MHSSPYLLITMHRNTFQLKFKLWRWRWFLLLYKIFNQFNHFVVFSLKNTQIYTSNIHISRQIHCFNHGDFFGHERESTEWSNAAATATSHDDPFHLEIHPNCIQCDKSHVNCNCIHLHDLHSLFEWQRGDQLACISLYNGSKLP